MILNTLRQTFLSICVCTTLTGQTRHKSIPAIRVGVLDISEVSNGCGDFISLCKPTNSEIEYIFATANDGNGMVIRVNNRLHHLSYVSQRIKESKLVPQSELKIGDTSSAEYSDGKLKVKFDSTIDEILGEGAGYHGTLTITLGRFKKVIKVCGAGGC